MPNFCHPAQKKSILRHNTEHHTHFYIPTKFSKDCLFYIYSHFGHARPHVTFFIFLLRLIFYFIFLKLSDDDRDHDHPYQASPKQGGPRHDGCSDGSLQHYPDRRQHRGGEKDHDDDGDDFKQRGERLKKCLFVFFMEGPGSGLCYLFLFIEVVPVTQNNQVVLELGICGQKNRSI